MKSTFLIYPAVLLLASTCAFAGPLPSPSAPVCNVVTPVPGPIFADSRFQGTSNQGIVHGTAFPYPNPTPNTEVRFTSLTVGETTPTLAIIPATVATPCPTPTINNIFNPEPIAAGQVALVTVWGSANAFNNAKFFQVAPTMNASTQPAAVAMSATPPAGYPASIAPPAIPAGYVGGYFLLSAANQATKVGQYNSISYTTSMPGDIFYRIDYEVDGNTGAKTVSNRGGSTQYRPILQYVTAPVTAAAGQCSGALTVQTKDGNGNTVDVMSGNSQVPGQGTNALQINISGSPATIFKDSNCVYPTSALTIQNPVPAPPPAPQPPTVTSPHQVTFWYEARTSQTFPITASFNNGGGGSFSVVQNEVIAAQLPIAVNVDGPTSVNQGACSAPLNANLSDQYGNEAPVQGSAKTLSLSGGSGVTFYADAACTMPISSLTFNVGQNNITFYAKSSISGLLSVSVAGGGLQSGTAEVHSLNMNSSVVTNDPVVAANLARTLYLRLVGTPPLPNDPNVQQMTLLILQGQVLNAAHIATGLDSFYNITIRNVATALSNLLNDPLVKLNDFTTTWIGIVRDDIDARQLLTGNTVYVPSSFATADQQSCAQPKNFIYDGNHNQISLGSTENIYASSKPLLFADNNFINLRKDLVPVRQCSYNSTDPSAQPVLQLDSAGLVTTRAFMAAHGFAGTNRRLVRKMFQAFLCKDITDVADNQMPDWHIRRDVDRAPGGLPATYTATCRSCHGGMDALAGAFAFYDSYTPVGFEPPSQGDYSVDGQRTFYVNKSGIYASDPCSGSAGANPKVNKNCTVFPAGYTTTDDSWVNFFISNHNAALGWDPSTPVNGNGVNSLGKMFANSAQFPACMAQRAFTAMCKRAPADADAQTLADLSQDFQVSGYNMRRLFEKAASLSTCLMNGGN